MRIEKIELIGFKSFSERTIFNFHPGITSIVGPNGCGKSNVVDAFRWVLGEQSAKTLRGEKMEEVIFIGSASKKPKGMAEVTMVVSGLNNTRQSNDGNGEDLSDIAAVTRRLYRSGDSEYILNKNQCRLKDVKDLFLDTGLEVKSYSILDQEGVSGILNSKPQERRFLLEEVAGIMKYNFRKKEALSKLELSTTNLQRINDITAEVKKQINLLDRIAKKAEKYKNLSSEIRTIELKIAKRDYQDLKGSFTAILSEYNSLNEEKSLKKTELAKIENLTEVKRLELLEKGRALEEVQRNLQDLEKQIAELEKSTAISKTDRANLKEYLIKLYQQEEEFNITRGETLDRKKELDIFEGGLLSDMEKYRKMLREKTELVRSLEEELSDKEGLLEGKRREIFNISEENSNLKNELSRLQSSLEDLNRREISSQKDLENLKKRLTEIDSSIKDIESNLRDKDNEILTLNRKKEILIKELSTSRNRVEEIRETLSSLREKLASCKSRLDSLREIVFDRPTRDLLSKELDLNLLESISDIFEVEAEYERAVESVLSEKVNMFILSSFNDIEIAVSSLREKSLGRTAFIPVNPQSRHPNLWKSNNPPTSPFSKGGFEGDFKGEQERLSEEMDIPEGAIGRASFFVRTPEQFLDVAKALLDNVFIVRNLKEALALRASGKRLFFVTLDGEVVEPSGAVIGGEVKGIFKKKREIRELEGIIENDRGVAGQMESVLISSQELIEKGETDLRDIESCIIDTEREISLLRLTTDNSKQEKERTERKLAYLNTEVEQLIGEKELIQKLIIEKDAGVQSVEAKRVDMENNSASLSEEIMEKRSRLEGYRSDLTEIRLSMTSLKEKVESAVKEKEALLNKVEEIDLKKGFLFKEISSVSSRISQREIEIKEYEEKIRSVVSAADKISKEISERKEVFEAENQGLLKADQDIKLLRREIDSLSHKVTELDISRAEHKVKLENLSEGISQNYGLDIDALRIEPLTPEDEERLIVLKGKVQELGPVNLGTIEEYEELRLRYEFLSKQREDLIKSIAELEEAIAKINNTTRKRLGEAFEALRSKFSEVFYILFGGGRVDLVLTDEDNILETGIDIIAQPPGKKLQNINLLSGGEKALTALSLLFASFLIKPTPLCILDEADATLDESNTERFAKMLQELSKDIQFIIVTHNRTTMSVADYLYGITMEEAGVSKVISMQLVEA
jgi:chromosome segregation protein